ncbi:hypothetical protein ACO1O0_005928 [Amphichorda felina]
MPVLDGNTGAADETATPAVGVVADRAGADAADGADGSDAAHARSDSQGPITPTNDEEAGNGSSSKPGRLPPSERFTARQKFYVFVLDGFGGMAISAGINFAIAYGKTRQPSLTVRPKTIALTCLLPGMYAHQDTQKKPVRLFQLPNTLAGDAGVTIIVQCIVTWFIEWLLVTHDLSNRSIQPLGIFPEPSRPILRWLFLLDYGNHHRPRTVLAKIFHQALRGFLICIPSFILLWPVSVGALTALGRRSGGDYVYPNRWTPQFFKFVLGGTLGLFTAPLMAMFWLVKAGWEGKTERPVSEEASV